MRLIVLAGLVSVEKRAMAVELAQHFRQVGQRVLLIDHASRMPLDAPDGVVQVDLAGDLRDGLPPALAAAEADMVILTAGETVRPDDLFLLLDDLRQQNPVLDVQTVALIDTRTCDCFPQFRVSLESYADVVVNLPVAAGEIVEVIA